MKWLLMFSETKIVLSIKHAWHVRKRVKNNWLKIFCHRVSAASLPDIPRRFDFSCYKEVGKRG